MSNPLIERLIATGVREKAANTFYTYHKKNPDIWKEFEALTLKAIASGKRVGSKAVFEKIRWDIEVEQRGTFKVSNSFAPYYSRIFELKHPQHKGFFKHKAVRSDLKGANG